MNVYNKGKYNLLNDYQTAKEYVRIWIVEIVISKIPGLQYCNYNDK